MACDSFAPHIVARLAKQVKMLMTRPPDGITYLPREGSLGEIHAVIVGPEQTPYYGGRFHLKLVLSEEYPTTPPKGYFITKIFHPNVAEKGDICVNTLKRDWKPTCTLTHVLQVIRCLLIVPFPESSLNDDAGKLFMENYDDYCKKAELMTRIHGKRAIEGYEDPEEIQQTLKQTDSTTAATSTTRNATTTSSTQLNSTANSMETNSTDTNIMEDRTDRTSTNVNAPSTRQHQGVSSSMHHHHHPTQTSSMHHHHHPTQTSSIHHHHHPTQTSSMHETGQDEDIENQNDTNLHVTSVPSIPTQFNDVSMSNFTRYNHTLHTAQTNPHTILVSDETNNPVLSLQKGSDASMQLSNNSIQGTSMQLSNNSTQGTSMKLVNATGTDVRTVSTLYEDAYMARKHILTDIFAGIRPRRRESSKSSLQLKGQKRKKSLKRL